MSLGQLWKYSFSGAISVSSLFIEGHGILAIVRAKIINLIRRKFDEFRPYILSGSVP